MILTAHSVTALVLDGLGSFIWKNRHREPTVGRCPVPWSEGIEEARP